MISLFALAALTLTPASATDLSLPPEKLAEESGGEIGQAQRLPHDVIVTVLGVIEDSRCPINARCIQAGRLVIRIKAARGGRTQTFTLEPWASVKFAGGQLTFSGAPSRGLTTDKPALEAGGRYSFTYTPAKCS